MAVFVNESHTLSGILSQIGYSRYMRTVRQNAFKCMERSANNRESLFEHISSGSKAEGLSALSENDTDIMIVPNTILCSEYPVRYLIGERKHTFHLSKRCTAPGYSMLQLANICESLPGADFIEDCIVELLPGQLYISSDIWKHSSKQASIEYFLEPGNTGLIRASNENHGPSSPISLWQMDFDAVFALTCYCPSYLYSWMTRERHHNWPTADVIEEVSELESHVVPVGNKNSPLQFMEWRICYTKGEIRLIRNLPDCLIKIYILMKAIVKVTLKPICKEISSYVIKNLILWIAELNPVECFSEKNLVIILQHALRFLKHCLVGKNLPSYIIPERNLFAERFTLQQRSRLCMRIDCLLREGPRVIMRVKKMKDALNMLYRSPQEFQLYCKRRQIIEVLALMLNVYAHHNCFDDENPGIESYLRNVFTDDFVNRILLYIIQLVPEIADTSDDGNEDARQGIDFNEVPINDAIRYFREMDEDSLCRNNPLFKYLS